MSKETLKVANSQLFPCPEGKEGTVIVIEYEGGKNKNYCTGQRINNDIVIDKCNNCQKYPWQVSKF